MRRTERCGSDRARARPAHPTSSGRDHPIHGIVLPPPARHSFPGIDVSTSPIRPTVESGRRYVHMDETRARIVPGGPTTRPPRQCRPSHAALDRLRRSRFK